VFAVGGITLFASHLINSEKLDLWLSLICGLLVAFMGLNLLLERSKTRLVVRTLFLKKLKTKIFNNNWFLRTKLLTKNCEEPVNLLLNGGSWEREFKLVKADISHHYHARGDGRIHSHLPPGVDGSAIT
jgi:nickel/cobalt exporter